MSEITKLNVLCVEDDLVVADYISSLLDKNKYRVRKINDGKKALDFLLLHTEQIDIVLLDYHLPSLDGIQILQSLKAQKISYPVIFLTVDETLGTAVKAISAGAIDYLPKSSFLKAELNIKIERAYQLFHDRKKSEHYEEQISLLTMAVEQSPNSFIITDKQGNIEYVNKKFIQSTGYSFEEVKGQNPRILKTNSYQPGFFEKMWSTISSGKTWKGEFTNRKKNGGIFYEKASIAPVFNKAGEIVSYIGNMEDVTGMRKIEAELLKKNEEMNRFFSVVVDPLCIIESHTNNFLKLNDAWEKILGFSWDELIGQPFMLLVHPSDIESTNQALANLKETGRIRNFVNRFKCKNGEYKFIEWSAIKNEDETIYASARDITERIKNETALKESETKFRTIFEMTNAGIFFSDRDGRIILANKALQSMVGYSFNELCLMDFSHFTYLDDLEKENNFLKKLIDGELHQYRLEKRYVDNKGHLIWVDLAMACIRDESGGLLYYVGVVNDIRERKQYEENLKNANDIKDKFFSIISHDLRSQFSGIEGLSDLLLKKNDDLAPETRMRYLRLLHNGGRSALNLLENLLEWSRLQLNRMEYAPQLCHLGQIAEEILDSIGNQAAIKQIKLVNQVALDQNIWADRNMISTVIRNLLNNAVKFTPANGQVEIRSWRLKDTDYISVKDNGVGMTAEKAASLFRPETIQSSKGTENEKGSGLGLVISHEFVFKHNGHITVKSEPRVGSEFTISLPAKANG